MPKSESKLYWFFFYLADFVWFYIKTPYYLAKGTIYLINLANKKQDRYEVKKKRSSMDAKYSAFKILKKEEGNVEAWESKIRESDSTIGIIVGARGSGKTAFCVRFFYGSGPCSIRNYKVAARRSSVFYGGTCFRGICSRTERKHQFKDSREG